MEIGRVQSHKGVTMVGAGHPSAESIDEALKFAPTLVAADGGADFALAVGLRPIAVIGDLDSLSDVAKAEIDPSCIIQVSEQDTTDFEKCLARIDAPFALAVGFSSGRLDHTLAAISALVGNGGPPTVLVGEDDIAFAVPYRIEIDLSPGTRVSLFPLAEVTGSSSGLAWPIDGLQFRPDGRIGTSNHAVGKVSLNFDSPGMIVILPRSVLDLVLPQLVG
ncbi:MAG: thiamine diphosphokinase [Boseongicola sp.]